MAKKIIYLLFIAAFLLPGGAYAFNFNANNVLSDSELTDSDSMSVVRIHDFLSKKGSALADYTNSGQTASQIIFNAAKDYGLSPKYFLVRVQVEQSLLTDSTPSQSQLDWATGYGCPDGSSCNSQYQGFFNQVIKSAQSLSGSNYLQGIADRGYTISGWGPGITKTTLDGIEVTPVNAATSVLFTYNPWVGKYGGGEERYGGVSLFAKLWNEWFIHHYPDGTLLQEEGSSGVYIIQNGKKRPFYNRSVLMANYDPKKIILVSSNDIDAYENGPAIQYPDNVILRSPKGTVYIISNGKKRGIASREVLQMIGINPEEILPASWRDLNAMPNGEPITETSIYPTGTLLQSRQTGGISYIENGVRHSIWSKEILNSRYKNRTVTITDDSEINAYPKGDPIKFKEGDLVTAYGNGTVYVISNGYKRPFKSADVFNALGYNWDNIIRTSSQALTVHPTGAKIEVE